MTRPRSFSDSTANLDVDPTPVAWLLVRPDGSIIDEAFLSLAQAERCAVAYAKRCATIGGVTHPHEPYRVEPLYRARGAR